MDVVGVSLSDPTIKGPTKYLIIISILGWFGGFACRNGNSFFFGLKKKKWLFFFEIPFLVLFIPVRIPPTLLIIIILYPNQIQYWHAPNSLQITTNRGQTRNNERDYFLFIINVTWGLRYKSYYNTWCLSVSQLEAKGALIYWGNRD